MTTSTVQKKACERESEAGNRKPSDHPNPNKLVWEQINAWVWATACGRFKLERFIVGEHERVGEDFTWPDRYRILKRTPEWYFEAAPTEAGLAAAKQVCEGLAHA